MPRYQNLFDEYERELRGLFRALAETGLEQATIVTYNDEETIVRDKKTVRVIHSCF